MANNETTRASAPEDRVLEASISPVVFFAGAGAGVAAAGAGAGVAAAGAGAGVAAAGLGVAASASPTQVRRQIKIKCTFWVQ